jgi:hypothetical protein
MPAGAEFLATEMAFDGEVVKGAPYSADAVTETVNVLSDGNRIVNTSRSRVYRDSEGRTRREQTLSGVGPWASDGAHELVLINDPVASTNFVLQPEKHTAQKLPAPKVRVISGGSAEAKADEKGMVRSKIVVAEVATATANPAEGGTIGAASTGTFEYRLANAKDAKKESLGKRTIEGVECDGTRSTITIAAGAIGNERPIEIISERWYSPELKTVVQSSHSDPRFGETTFRMTNITRTEPDKSLFELPSDYTVVNVDASPMRVRVRAEAAKPDKKN